MPLAQGMKTNLALVALAVLGLAVMAVCTVLLGAGFGVS